MPSIPSAGPGDVFSRRIPHFFDLLSQLDTAIPIQSQWVVVIHHFPKALIEQVSKYEGYDRGQDAWTNIKACITHATAGPLQDVKGCIFANEVEIPGESVEIQRAGEGYRGGYAKGPLTPSRADFGSFKATFLETNLSFGDLVLRPWAIMVAHLGLLVREGTTAENTIKSDIQVYHLAKHGAGKPLIVRKQFNFYECVPIVVTSENYDSLPQTATKTRQVEFLYSYYTADTSSIMMSEQPQVATGPPPNLRY